MRRGVMADEEILAYCVKEKARKPMKDPEIITLKNGKRALRGTCASCGAKMVRLISKEKKQEVEVEIGD